jgi:hypothetical protein
MKDPISCGKCYTSFCKRCLQNKTFKENRCPRCKEPNAKYKKLHMILLHILELSKVQCKHCLITIAFFNLLDHEVDCKL